MLQATVNDKNKFTIDVQNGEWQVDNKIVGIDIDEQPNGLISMIIDSKSYTAIIENIDHKAKELTVTINGQKHKIAIEEEIDLLLSNMGLDLKAMKKQESIKAPMPGMILKILVTPGQQINKGDGLLILEAMKMENVIKAGGPGTVKSIKAIEKTAVEKGAILIELE